MIIDSHGHVTAPDSLYVYKAQILAHRGAHGRGGNLANEDDVRKALNSPVFGGSSHLDQLKEVGTDMQLVSPRPYQMMTSESPKLVQWFVEETNNIIAKQVQLYPNTFRGVCGLPLTPGVSPKAIVPYLEKCVKEQGFVGCLLNPDPGECSGVETPALGDRFWYPLYEKMVELDIPGHIHSTGCRSERLPYSLHFINEESIGVVSLLDVERVQGLPDAEDSRVARRRRHPVPVRPLRGQLAASSRRDAVLRGDAASLLRHGALLEGRARTAVQDRRRGPLPVRHRAARRRARSRIRGPADGSTRRASPSRRSSG